MIDVRSCNAVRHTSCAGPHPTVAVGGHPIGVAVDEPRHTAYVADADGKVAVLDTRACNARPHGCAVLGTLAVPEGAPSDIVTNPATGTRVRGGGPSRWDGRGGGLRRVDVQRDDDRGLRADGWGDADRAGARLRGPARHLATGAGRGPTDRYGLCRTDPVR